MNKTLKRVLLVLLLYCVVTFSLAGIVSYSDKITFGGAFLKVTVSEIIAGVLTFAGVWVVNQWGK